MRGLEEGGQRKEEDPGGGLWAGPHGLELGAMSSGGRCLIP